MTDNTIQKEADEEEGIWESMLKSGESVEVCMNQRDMDTSCLLKTDTESIKCLEHGRHSNVHMCELKMHPNQNRSGRNIITAEGQSSKNSTKRCTAKEHQLNNVQRRI